MYLFEHHDVSTTCFVLRSEAPFFGGWPDTLTNIPRANVINCLTPNFLFEGGRKKEGHGVCALQSCLWSYHRFFSVH